MAKPKQRTRPLMVDGPTIRELRLQTCRSVREVAEHCNVWTNMVYGWERGDTVPPLREAILMAKLFGMSVEDINWWPSAVKE